MYGNGETPPGCMRYGSEIEYTVAGPGVAEALNVCRIANGWLSDEAFHSLPDMLP